LAFEPISPHHRAALEAFCCATEADATSQLVERAVRTQMLDEIDAGLIGGLGFCERDGRLSAVVFFTRGSYFWRVLFLATDLEFRRRKRALRLKRELMEVAAAEGASALSSVVSEGNGPMLELNRKLKAHCEPRGDGFVVCTLLLQ
jgi:hypothetical protein